MNYYDVVFLRLIIAPLSIGPFILEMMKGLDADLFIAKSFLKCFIYIKVFTISM